jgi:hypothetical protein
MYTYIYKYTYIYIYIYMHAYAYILRLRRRRGGMARAAMTQVVNATCQKENGILVINDQHPIFEKYEEKRQQRFFEESAKGDYRAVQVDSKFTHTICAHLVSSPCVPQINIIVTSGCSSGQFAWLSHHLCTSC